MSAVLEPMPRITPWRDTYRQLLRAAGDHRHLVACARPHRRRMSADGAGEWSSSTTCHAPSSAGCAAIASFPAREVVLGTLGVIYNLGDVDPGEEEGATALVRRLRGEGLTVVLIEHVMRALMALSDRVLIMNHGRELFAGTPADVVRNEEVIEVYLGR